MVVSIFRSRIRPEHEAEYQALAAEMLTIARAMPGFLTYRFFSSEDGERCSIIEFETLEALHAWRDEPRHRKAQQLGRERFYSEYSLCVAEPIRESSFQL